jgi:hypothetical protein
VTVLTEATVDWRETTPVLMVAERFPPHANSGTARPLYFARHLPEFGYRPVVLAAPVLGDHPSDPDLLHRVPHGIHVCRPTPAMAIARTVANSALAAMRAHRPRPQVSADAASRAAGDPAGSAAAPAAAPPSKQRMASLRETIDWLMYWHLDWLPPAFVRGLAVGWKREVKLVWVTAPHVRNLLLGYALSRALRRPLVVDLRDPWTYGSLWKPVSRLAETIERGWSRTILNAAALVVFTSPFTQCEMEARFPRLRGKCLTITNGFSADDERIGALRGGFESKCLLRHSGVLNDRRRPDVLLRGLALAIEREPAIRSSIHLELIGDLGPNQDALSRSGLADCVSALGRVSRMRSLALMRGADVNVLLQTIGSGTDVIAGKAFDYLAARRPILGIVDPQGGDAWLLRQTTGNLVVSYEREQDIADAVAGLHARWQRGQLLPLSDDLAVYERRHLTERLAGAFDRLLQ